MDVSTACDFSPACLRWRNFCISHVGPHLALCSDCEHQGSANNQIAEVGATFVVFRMKLTVCLCCSWWPIYFKWSSNHCSFHYPQMGWIHIFLLSKPGIRIISWLHHVYSIHLGDTTPSCWPPMQELDSRRLYFVILVFWGGIGGRWRHVNIKWKGWYIRYSLLLNHNSKCHFFLASSTNKSFFRDTGNEVLAS